MTMIHRLGPLIVIAFAASLFLGLAITAPPGDGVASLLASLREHQLQANLTGLFRGLTSILVVPALLAIAPAITVRGRRLFTVAAIALYLGNTAGIVVITHVIIQTNVLAPYPDQTTALTLAEAIDVSVLWQAAAVTYLLGLLVGFLLLGVAVWRAGHGRLIGLAIGAGLLLHISAGDWILTSLGGTLILAAGLSALAPRIANHNRGVSTIAKASRADRDRPTLKLPNATS